MSTYTGSTNQLWYFESGGQPVFVGNNIVAMNGDTLQYNYGVTESMIQPYGYITAYGERITWSSDNTDAITIAANGKVTINGAGKAVLTATVKNSSGTRSREYSYTVIISLGNGLYRIKNKATGLYLGVDGNQYLNYDDVVMTEKITSGIEQYNQLWKIYHIGNGVYSIRLLPKLNMGLDVTDSTVDIYSIGMTDTVSGVPSYGEWDFEWKGSNDYLLRHKGLTSSVVTASTNGVTVSSNDNSNTQLWQFEEVEFDSGLVLFDTPSWLAPKESGSVRSSVYSYYLMDQGVTLTSDNEAVARISSGNIIGVSEGVATITVTSNVVASWSKSFTVSVTPFENGIYIFENKETKKAIQPDDNGDFHIEQFEFDSEWYQFWGFERHVDQYYRIINKENGLCLTSPVSTESELELSLEAWNEAIQSRQLWKITELSDQSFVLQSQLMETASLVMSVGGGLNVNGINIVQKEFTSNSDYSEQWIIKNTNVELYVPYFAQWTTKWCWVTSAQMMVRAMYPSAANYGDEAAILEEQRRAVYHVYGDPSIAYEDYDWDNDENLQELNKQTGDYISVGKAAAFLAGMVDADVTYSAYLTPYSQEGLVGFLVNGYAVCCLRGTLKIPYPVTNDNLEETLTNNSENLFSGHVIVVTGCRWDSDEGQYIFTINDPWTYQEDQNGNQINIYESEVDIEENKYEMSYGDLIFENEMKETYFSATLWFPTVVTKTDFSGKTILEEVLEFEYDS